MARFFSKLIQKSTQAIVKMGLFFFIFVFSTKKLTEHKCPIKVANDWIQTRGLWYQKRPRYQLCHNHCPYQAFVVTLPGEHCSLREMKACICPSSKLLCLSPYKTIESVYKGQ